MSDWIDGDVKPEHPGRYECVFGTMEPTVASWDGRVWRHDKLPPADQRADFKWRAIAQPKEA